MFPVDVDVEVVEAAVTAEADVLMEDPVTKKNKKSSEFGTSTLNGTPGPRSPINVGLEIIIKPNLT